MHLTSHAKTPAEMKADIIALLDQRIKNADNFSTIIKAVKIRAEWKARADSLRKLRDELITLVIAEPEIIRTTLAEVAPTSIE